jgi:CHAD domain-containing protein
LLRRRGIDVDPERLEDRVAAVRSRKEIDDAVDIEHVRSLATAVKRARRHCELAEMDWRWNPCNETLQAARQAQQARTAAENELREQLLGDQDLFSDVMRSVR